MRRRRRRCSSCECDRHDRHCDRISFKLFPLLLLLVASVLLLRIGGVVSTDYNDNNNNRIEIAVNEHAQLAALDNDDIAAVPTQQLANLSLDQQQAGRFRRARQQLQQQQQQTSLNRQKVDSLTAIGRTPSLVTVAREHTRASIGCLVAADDATCGDPYFIAWYTRNYSTATSGATSVASNEQLQSTVVGAPVHASGSLASVAQVSTGGATLATGHSTASANQALHQLSQNLAGQWKRLDVRIVSTTSTTPIDAAAAAAADDDDDTTKTTTTTTTTSTRSHTSGTNQSAAGGHSSGKKSKPFNERTCYRWPPTLTSASVTPSSACWPLVVTNDDASRWRCVELVIDDVSVHDERQYKCEITYSDNYDGVCPSVTVTRFQVLGDPDEPEILVNGNRLVESSPTTASSNVKDQAGKEWSAANFDHGTTLRGASVDKPLLIGPLLEGAQVRLECRSSGGRPKPTVDWINVTAALNTFSVGVGVGVGAGAGAGAGTGANSNKRVASSGAFPSPLALVTSISNSHRQWHYSMLMPAPRVASNSKSQYASWHRASSGSMVGASASGGGVAGGGAESLNSDELLASSHVIVTPTRYDTRSVFACVVNNDVGIATQLNAQRRLANSNNNNNNATLASLMSSDKANAARLKFFKFDVVVKPTTIRIDVHVQRANQRASQLAAAGQQIDTGSKYANHAQTSDSSKVNRDTTTGSASASASQNFVIGANDQVFMKCIVDGSRPAANITWYSQRSEQRHLDETNLELLTDSTFRSWSVLPFTPSMCKPQTPYEFSCKANMDHVMLSNATDSLSTPLISSVQVFVQCPPVIKDIVNSIDGNRIRLRRTKNIDGELIVDPSFIECTSQSLPSPFYQWRHIMRPGGDEQLLTDGPVLDLRQLAMGAVDNQPLSGQLMCIATNDYGSSNRSVTIEEFARPICRLSALQIANTGHDDATRHETIVCEANSMAPIVEYVWYKNNQLIDRKSISGLDAHVLTLEPSLIGRDESPQTDVVDNYKCIVRNTVGYSDACQYEHRRLTSQLNSVSMVGPTLTHSSNNNNNNNDNGNNSHSIIDDYSTRSAAPTQSVNSSANVWPIIMMGTDRSQVQWTSAASLIACALLAFVGVVWTTNLIIFKCTERHKLMCQHRDSDACDSTFGVATDLGMHVGGAHDKSGGSTTDSSSTSERALGAKMLVASDLSSSINMSTQRSTNKLPMHRALPSSYAERVEVELLRQRQFQIQQQQQQQRYAAVAADSTSSAASYYSPSSWHSASPTRLWPASSSSSSSAATVKCTKGTATAAKAAKRRGIVDDDDYETETKLNRRKSSGSTTKTSSMVAMLAPWWWWRHRHWQRLQRHLCEHNRQQQPQQRHQLCHSSANGHISCRSHANYMSPSVIRGAATHDFLYQNNNKNNTATATTNTSDDSAHSSAAVNCADNYVIRSPSYVPAAHHQTPLMATSESMSVHDASTTQRHNDARTTYENNDNRATPLMNHSSYGTTAHFTAHSNKANNLETPFDLELLAPQHSALTSSRSSYKANENNNNNHDLMQMLLGHNNSGNNNNNNNNNNSIELAPQQLQQQQQQQHQRQRHSTSLELAITTNNNNKCIVDLDLGNCGDHQLLNRHSQWTDAGASHIGSATLGQRMRHKALARTDLELSHSNSHNHNSGNIIYNNNKHAPMTTRANSNSDASANAHNTLHGRKHQRLINNTNNGTQINANRYDCDDHIGQSSAIIANHQHAANLYDNCDTHSAIINQTSSRHLQQQQQYCYSKRPQSVEVEDDHIYHCIG